MLKKVNWGSALSAIILIVVGLFMIINPNASGTVISNIIGYGAIGFGLIKIITYFSFDILDCLYHNEFAVGLILIIFGLLVLFKQNIFVDLIPFVFGIIIFMSGFLKLQQGVLARRMGYHNSNIYTILAIISIVFGLAIMFMLNGQTIADMVFIVIGCGLVYCGVSDLVANFYLASKFNNFVKNFERDNRKEDIIDIEVKDEEES